MEYFPSASVCAFAVPGLTCMVAPAMGSLSLSSTVPLITLWAKADTLSSIKKLSTVSFSKEYNLGLLDKTAQLLFGRVMFIVDFLFWLEKMDFLKL
jgi:hypothetical protein